MGGCKSLMLFLCGGFFFCFEGKRTRDFAFVSLCYGRSGEEICTGYAMAARGRMQYDYKQTKTRFRLIIHEYGIISYESFISRNFTYTSRDLPFIFLCFQYHTILQNSARQQHGLSCKLTRPRNS